MTRVYRDQSPNPATIFPIISQNNETMSTAVPHSIASPSPIPVPSRNLPPRQQAEERDIEEPPNDQTQLVKKPSLCPKARLRIHLEDLGHPAISKFTNVIPIANLLENAIRCVEAHLFTTPSDSHSNDTTIARPPPQRPIPNPTWKPQEVRSLTLILRPMDGVAYTSGTDLDEAHKEINLSLNYLEAIIKKFYSRSTSTSSPESSTSAAHDKKADAAFLHEVLGVVTHETVHAFQHNAHSTCPGGLIEGIADYVRMKSKLGAAHWNPWPANKKTRGERWDSGYEKTAWFLQWVEEHIGGVGCVGRLNETMRKEKWEDGKVWKAVMGGVSVDECWELYRSNWEEMNKHHDGDKDDSASS